MSIYLILAVSFLNSVAQRAARVVLPLYALDLGARPFAVGVLAATFSILPMFTSVPAGKLADRFGSRWLLVIGAIGGGLGLLVPYFSPGLPALYIAAGMIGLSLSVYNVSLQNLVGLLSNPLNRTQNFSNFSLTYSLANFAGPLIAGFSIERFGHASSCLYLALFTLIPIAMLTSRGGTFEAGPRRAKDAAGGSIRDMLSEPGVRRVLVTGSLLHVGQDLYQFYMPVYTHAIGLAPSTIGIVLAMFAAAAFVVRLILPALIARFTDEKVLTYAFFISAASLMLVPFFHDGTMLALISFIFGLGMGGGQPIVTMLMFTNSAEGRSGEALGLRLTVNHFTKIVGPVVFGMIGSVFGLFPMFWVNGLMMVAGGVISRRKIGG